MRLIRKTLTGTGSILATLDPHKIYYAISATLYGDNAINATAQVDATVSDLTNKMPVTVSRSGTTVTVTFQTNHFLGATTDYVLISGTGNSSLDGLYPVASVTSTTVLTYTSGTSGTVATINCLAIPIKRINAFIASAAVSASTPALPTISASTLNPTILPYSGLILTCSAYTAGTILLDVLEVGLK